jgi:hypothetical protein
MIMNEKLITIDEEQLTEIVAEQNKNIIAEEYAQNLLEVADGIDKSAELIVNTSLAAIELYRKTKSYLEALFSGGRAVPPDTDTAEAGEMYLKSLEK